MTFGLAQIPTFGVGPPEETFVANLFAVVSEIERECVEDTFSTSLCENGAIVYTVHGTATLFQGRCQLCLSDNLEH